MPQQTSAQQPLDPWLAFVRGSGAEGRRWARGYRRWEPVAAMNPECLALLHARRWEEGAERLSCFRAAVDAAWGADPATRAVLERWYQAVYGYFLYCRESYEEADLAMVAAGEAVAAAVGDVPSLLPLVHHCHEFRLHRARIARNQGRWAAMREHVEEVRSMFEGRAPYCLLPDGRAVGIAEVKAFHRCISGLDLPEREAAEEILDDQRRMASFDRFVHQLYRFSGMVIPYP